MVEYIRNNVNDGLWIVGVVHGTGHETNNADMYFNDTLNVPLHRVGLQIIKCGNHTTGISIHN